MRAKRGETRINISYYYGLATRLALAILLSVNSLAIFYFVFTPLTIYPSFWLLKLFYPVSLEGNSVLYGKSTIELINACIAGSAYYLLALLNLATKGVTIGTRIKAFAFSAGSFLALNILRIVILALTLFSAGNFVFDQIHIAFWVIGSTLFVILIWLLTIKIYRIREIPVYSDFVEVLKLFKPEKEKRVKIKIRNVRRKSKKT